MNDPDLYDTMTTLGKRAPSPPADLIDRVMARQRRRRRRQAATAAFAAVLALSAGVLAISRPDTKTSPIPTADFRLPSLPSDLPSITQAWPSATVTGELPKTPDGTTVTVLGRIDPDHLLVGTDDTTGTRPSFLWQYTVTNRTYERLIMNPFRTVHPQRFAVAGHRLVQVQGDGIRQTKVWAYTPSGHDVHAIATTTDSSPVTGVYVDDRYVYWTFSQRAKASDARIVRVPLAGGNIEPLTGFSGLTSNGSAWASNSDNTIFRNLSDGQERHAVRSPNTDTLNCVPAFCLGHDQAGWFLQRPDGTGRTALSYPGIPRLVGALSAPPFSATNSPGSGLLLLGGNILLDPVSGRYGAIAGTATCDLDVQPFKNDVAVRWRTSASGGCTGTEQTAYIGES